MPQFRARTADPAVVADRMRSEVRDGVPDSRSFLATTDQIRRVGNPRVRELAAYAGKARSARTIRRWRQQGRIPDAGIAVLVQRTDQIERWGGPAAAAQRLGVSESDIAAYLAHPDNQLPASAAEAAATHDRAEARRHAGIPVNRAGTPVRLPTLQASGSVWVKGDTDSEEYSADRNVDITLDDDTTEAILAASETGDFDAAREAAEAYLSTHHAGCVGYGDDYGWHFSDLDSFTITWS